MSKGRWFIAYVTEVRQLAVNCYWHGTKCGNLKWLPVYMPVITQTEFLSEGSVVMELNGLD